MIESWPQLHVARGALLAQMGRSRSAIDEYRAALDLSPPAPEAAYIARRIDELETIDQLDSVDPLERGIDELERGLNQAVHGQSHRDGPGCQ